MTGFARNSKFGNTRRNRFDVDVWLWHLAREPLTRLTFEPSQEVYVYWTPDGQQIVYGSNQDGFFSVYRKSADGTGDVERLTDIDDNVFPTAVTPEVLKPPTIALLKLMCF